MIAFIAACVAGYVAGSFPSAYLAGRMLRGVDLRTLGSGNLGATNVLREVGAPAAVGVLFVDALKGWAPVALLPGLVGPGHSPWLPVAIGVSAVIGHMKPIFLLWRGGGKGVATGAGVFLALAPAAVGIAFAAFVLAVAVTRYVSVGSIASAVVLPVAVAAIYGARTPVLGAGVVLGALVIWMHRTNVARIVNGQESRLSAARGKQ